MTLMECRIKMRTAGKPGRKYRNEREFWELEEEKNGDGTKAILEGDNGAFGGGFYLLHVFDLF